MQKKIISSIVIVILTVIIIGSNVLYCASVGVSPSSISLYVGETATITIDGSGVAGNISAVSNNNTIVSINSVSSNWIENNKITVSIRANAVGNASITVSGKVANLNNSEDESEISKLVNINVKEKVVENNNNNNTNNTNNTSSNNTTSNNSNNNSSTKVNTSSNNYLKSLQISEEGLTPDFVKTKTNYTLSVGPKVTSINVNAKAEDSSATVTVSGNTDLKDGDNNIYITVVAENGNKRTYTIIVNKSADPVKSNSYLSNLIIRDMELSPVFSNEVLEYDGGTINTNETKIDIYAYPTNENAKVEIIGNENLVLGENVITIKITSEDGTSTKEYKIKFVREEETLETQALTEVKPTDDNEFSIKSICKDILQIVKANALLLLMYLLVIVEFVQILYLYKKLREKEAPKDENKDSFEQYNVSLDDVKEIKEDEKELLEEANINEDINEQIDTIDEETIVEENVEENKVKTIWDEDKPDFSEELENDIEQEKEIKKRKGSDNLGK